MTAEIAVLNKYGIALAADSAVSIGTRKIYNSANKLFALTKHYPVGVMIYGNAHFMGVPWETIIKFYRKNVLKDKKFETIDAYMEDLLKFLSTASIFSSDGEAEFVRLLVSVTLSRLIQTIKDRVGDVIKQQGKISPDDNKKLTDQLIQEWLDKQNETRAQFPRGIRASFTKSYGTSIAQLVDKLLPALGVSKPLQSAVKKALVDGFGRKVNSLSPTGLVVAGFGEDEIFPAVASVWIDGKIGPYLRIFERRAQKVGYTNNAVIMPFAQREMVDLFMQGSDPQLHSAIHRAIASTLASTDEHISACSSLNLDDATKAAIKAHMEKVHEELANRIEGIKRKHFVQPVLGSVASLPLDELAAMAESLVNLTTLKRRVTPVPESVGGPVDVAVISKGDGFIWIKRKHYFSPELNPHFFR